jgi:Fe-S-cluster containining protein
MTKLVLTFPPTLRYTCEIEACQGCCSLFEEIELASEDVRTLEKLGYSSFYRDEKKRLLRKPCVFLRGKLCEIHIRHGVSAKPSVCRRYPFSVSFLNNGWSLVDVKWACRGVGAEDGEALTMEYVTRELMDFLTSQGEKIPVGGPIPLSDEGDKRVSWEGIKKLYDFASEEVLLTNTGLKEKIGKLVYLLIEFTEACPSEKITTQEEVQMFLKGLRLKPWEIEEAQWDAEINYYGVIDELFSSGITPGNAARRLGLDLKITSPADPALARGAEELFSLYMSQCLRETLSKPWSLRASFYWAMGVMGLVDFVTRCTAKDEVSEAGMRQAIAVVDFLNKSYRGFRDHAYPLYPDLGLHYLSLVLTPSQ